MKETPLPEFRIDRYDVPGVWENYLSNDEYCVIITPTGRGLSFYRYLPFFRVTRGGRAVYLRDAATGSAWGVGQEPPHPGRDAVHEDVHPLVLTQDAHTAQSGHPFPLAAASQGFDAFECVHRPFSTTIGSLYRGIAASLEVIVPREGAGEVWVVTLENRGDVARELALMPTVGLILGGGTAMLGNYPTFNVTDWDAAKGVFTAANLGIRYHDLPNLHAAFVAGEPPGGMTATVEEGLIALRTGKASNRQPAGEAVQVMFLHDVKLAPGERRTFTCALAAGTDPAEARERAHRWSRAERAVALRREAEEGWRERLSRFRVELPDAEFAEFVNGWLQVELAQCARWTRGGGERGYRDVLQDAWALALLDPPAARRMLAEALAHQYVDGHAPRSYPPPPFDRCPVNERLASDSPLWIPLALAGYLRETGDTAFLREPIGFLDRNRRAGDEWEGWAVVLHAVLAIRHVFAHRGKRGLPLLLAGDWNDGLDHAGLEGRGESVWSGMAFVWAAEETAFLLRLASGSPRESAPRRDREEEPDWAGLVAEAEDMAARMRRAVEEHGWDEAGGWWKRGFTDADVPLGASDSPEGKVYLLPQAWAALARLGDEGRRRRAFAAVDGLLDTPVGPKLLHPPYTVRDPGIGRITARVPGTSDNAGVQTHAGVMKATADLAAGRAEEGVRTLRALTPLHPRRRGAVIATPPFVLNSQTIGPDNPRFGAVEIGWLTGAAGWMLRAVGERLLGLRPEGNGLRIDPCVPPAWRTFGAERVFRGVRYRVRFSNPDGVSRGVREVRVNGAPIEGSLLPCTPTSGRGEMPEAGPVEVEVTMGVDTRSAGPR